MKFIKTADINYGDKTVYNDYYRTYMAKFVHGTGLPEYVHGEEEKRKPLVTKTEAAKKKLKYDSSKIYGFLKVWQGFVPLYHPKDKDRFEF